MLGDIVFHNPTKLIFGEGSLKHLKEEIKDYNNILLSYGSGSIKKNGIYDQVINILKEAGKKVLEDPGVMPNPTNKKVYEGCKRAKEINADLILAVGGGSCCDYAKTVSISTYCDGDFYEKYFINGENVDCKTIPVACILTLPGTGSEMNEGAVISNPDTNSKLGFYTGQYPIFSILDPTFTYSLPKYQMVSGIFDILSHIMENYFAGFDDNTTDYLAEGLMNSLINSSRIAIKNPKDYEARSNIMWCATWGLNYMLNCGKFDGDWQVHCLGETLGGFTDATHGMTLSAISLPYYRYIMNEGIDKFARFAKNVWHIDQDEYNKEELAKAGLDAMENWMKEIGVVLHAKELGLTEEIIPQIAKKSPYVTGSYKPITEKEACEILKASL